MTEAPLFTLRIAEMKDAEAIGRVHTASWRTTYPGILPQTLLDGIDLEKRIQGARSRITGTNVTCLVLVENASNQVVGFADYGANREKSVAADGELYGIYLLQAHQGKGGGRLLLEECARGLRHRRFSRMMISVFRENYPSRKFYERLGGRCIGEDRVEIAGVFYPTSTYLWELNNEGTP